MFDHWLSPVDLKEIKILNGLTNQHWGKKISVYLEEMPNLSGVKLALIGVGHREANEVRQALYRLSFPFKGLQVTDLGNARKTTPAFLIPLITELLNSGIIPILIGKDPSLTEAQFLAYQPLKQLINLAIVDEQIQYTPGKKKATTYLNRILDNPRSHLFHLGIMGHQQHFLTNEQNNFFQKYGFEQARLGWVRSNMEQIEPLIRDADLLCMNIAALRKSEAPGQTDASPSGFFNEEACQISRYAGMSDKLTSASFFGFDHQLDTSGQTAAVIAQLIWYFTDGFYSRKNDYPANTESLVEYIVDFKNHDYDLTFWKSTRSGRWWMQVPIKTKRKHKRHALIPCSYQDYQLASRDDLPDRLLNAYKRFT